MKKRFAILNLFFSIGFVSIVSAQDQLLGILKQELAVQMEELRESCPRWKS